MCCCAFPNINGTPGYLWTPGGTVGIRPVSPPELAEGDTLVFDEPGRCGGIDSHCHHYRVVRDRVRVSLLVRHGGGDERIRLSNGPAVIAALETLDSNERYWLLNALHHAQSDAHRMGYEAATSKWYKAAAEGRIKTRKLRNQNRVRVELVPA